MQQTTMSSQHRLRPRVFCHSSRFTHGYLIWRALCTFIQDELFSEDDDSDPSNRGSRARNVRTCQGLRPRRAGRVLAITPASVSPSAGQTASALRTIPFAARWLACTIPYRRFVSGLAAENARLGADVDRYSFIAVDSHHLLLAGLPAHLTRIFLLLRKRVPLPFSSLTKGCDPERLNPERLTSNHAADRVSWQFFH